MSSPYVCDVIPNVIPTFRDVYPKDVFLPNVSCYSQDQYHIQGWHAIPNVILEWHVIPAFRDDMSIPRISISRICVLPYVSCHPQCCPCIQEWHVFHEVIPNVILEVIPVFGDDMSSLTSSRHLGVIYHPWCHPCIWGWHNWGWHVILKVIPIFRDDMLSLTSSHLLFPFTKEQTTALHSLLASLFAIDSSMTKLMSNSDSSFYHHSRSDLKVLWMGLLVKTNMGGQAKHGLWDSNVKTGKYLCRGYQGWISCTFMGPKHWVD